MTRPPDLDTLMSHEKDVLIHALWAQVQEIEALRAANAELSRHVADLEARLGAPTYQARRRPPANRRRFGLRS